MQKVVYDSMVGLSLDPSMEFGDSEIADLLSAATTSHLGGPQSVAPPVLPQAYLTISEVRCADTTLQCELCPLFDIRLLV